MKRGLYWRLSVMMFLQYAIWGAWLPVLSNYMADLKFSGWMIAVVYNLVPLGTLLSPVTGGQLADRYVATEWFLVVANLIGAVVLYIAGTLNLAGMPAETAFWTLTALMLIHGLVYGPTLALTNSLSFRHLENVERQFGAIRVWGTIGWMAAGVFLTAWRQESLPAPEAAAAVAWYAAIWNSVTHGIGAAFVTVLGSAGPGSCLVLTAAFSLLLGLFSILLPHTPPKREGVKPLAFVEAFGLLRKRDFLIFSILSFVLMTQLCFYFLLAGPFLEKQVGIRQANVSAVLTTGQIGEIITMAILLPLLLPRLGVRLCLTIGMFVWPIRFAIFSIGQPWELVVASLPLHGFGYVFFFVVGQIYSDMVSPRDSRASVQSLWAVFVLGIGMILGNQFAGWVMDLFTKEEAIEWGKVFLVPCVVTILGALVFMLFFREPEKKETP